jgi:hypothetical protein
MSATLSMPRSKPAKKRSRKSAERWWALTFTGPDGEREHRLSVHGTEDFAWNVLQVVNLSWDLPELQEFDDFDVQPDDHEALVLPPSLRGADEEE